MSHAPGRSTLASILFLTLCLVLLAAPAVPALGKKHPEPSPYPTAWEFKFTHGMPKRIVIDTTPYWYISYTVTNEGKEEQPFYPVFEMVTSDGKVVQSDKRIPKKVFEQVRRDEGDDLMQSAIKIAGPLPTGEDQARHGAAIWKEPMARMGTFRIFVQGLSGEFVEMTDDNDKPMKNKDGTPLLLHKTLELTYNVPGDEIKPGEDVIHEKGHRWVMR